MVTIEYGDITESLSKTKARDVVEALFNASGQIHSYHLNSKPMLELYRQLSDLKVRGEAFPLTLIFTLEDRHIVMTVHSAAKPALGVYEWNNLVGPMAVNHHSYA